MTRPPNDLVISKRGDVRSFLAMDVLAEASRMRLEGRADGRDVLMMCVGQPAAPAPREARDAARSLIGTGPIGYTDAAGRTDLRARLTRYYGETYGVDLAPDRVFVTTGSSAGFNLAFLALLDPGARVAIASPGYPAYRNIIAALSLEVVEIPVGEDTRWTLDAKTLLASHRKRGIDAVLLASPGNPTGTMAKPETLAELVGACRDAGIRVISDEIYHRLTYPEATGIEEATALVTDDNVVVVNSFSKYFCMTGWRIGWMVLPQAMVRPMERLGQNLYISAPEVSQIAAFYALDAEAELEATRQGYAANRAVLLERLPKLGFGTILPIDGAFYAYADASALMAKKGCADSLELCRELLAATGVAITPGLDFDLERGGNYVRISFAGSAAEIAEACDRIAAWV